MAEGKQMKPCGWCKIPHRYGTTDPHHKWVAMACINSLNYRVKEQKTELRRLRKELASAS